VLSLQVGGGYPYDMVKKIILLCVTLFLSVCFVLMSAFFGTTSVESHDQLQNAQFGFPIRFIKQDLTSAVSGYEGNFPHRFEMYLDFLDGDVIIDFLLLNFVFSVTIVFGIVLICYLLTRKIWFSKN
jgi:hypothetical protein